ncbi:cell division protein ZapA [Erythrobacter sp. HKB08]|uniref:cell division protein ZapA n=1 Tax=Erythrobacter sp. HKB08 TaxID=2502843 RepID=UPI0010092419|nr:cell division protein ZapA [Erythrobacter sp. HKB08]
MSEVKVSIGGRTYAVACGEGEEAHVVTLSEMLDEKLKAMGTLSPQESQNLLFAGLFVADDLHEARKQVISAAEGRKAVEAELDEAKREARNATGQTDELKARIAELESELDGIQSAQQRHASEVDELRGQLISRRNEAHEAEKDRDAAQARVTELEQEAAELREKLEQASAIPPHPFPSDSGAAGADVADLAPALERFADLLENCADKLEGRTAQP